MRCRTGKNDEGLGHTGVRTLVHKQSTNTSAVVYHIQIDSTGVVYTYQTANGIETTTVPEVIPAKTWTHIAIQAYKTIVSFYINGVGPGYSATYTTEVTGPLLDETGTLRVGQDHSGNGQFLGRIQDFFVYSTTLSNREIQEIYTGFLPDLRVQTNCRCPVTHPRVRPDKTHYCIPNNVIDNSGDVILRLNDEAHFLEYINDGDSNSVWLSKFQNKVEISIDLGDIFQVFYVVLQFYSPFSKAVTIERKQNYSSDWTTWQYYAEDCQHYYGQPNNGPLLTPTSVNCLQFVQDDIPYSGGQITFKILSPEPVTRPAYNQFYETPELQDFVKASIIKITLEDHYYSNHFRHEYFGMSEITVSGRCDCNGHANDCDTSGMPYTCNCTTDSHTEGSKCERCHPLYNNKGYKLGDQINSYNCKHCECHSHADICVYDVDLDLFPDNHDLGGGGQFCDICVTYFFRPVGKSKYDKDVCSQCDCLMDGVNNVNLDCEKDGGQCNCKSYVESRQCDTCKPGFYNLQATNPDGCDNCSCVTMGTQHGDVTCHPITGVCNCKNNVRNDKCDACKYGYYNLTDTNPLGCTPCDCNPMGATSQFCEPFTGQCPCEDRVVGRKCDVCTSGYYDFFNNCVPCKCDVQGTIPGSICNAVTGQCVCKTNVQGLACNECADGSYAFGASTDKGCNDCTCDLAGTINSTSSCDKVSGNCHCKENVEGMSCNQCKGNTFGLNITDPEGCQSCKCDPTGTQSGNSSTDLACDQNTGQCACLAKRFGRTCDDCEQDYYINPTPGGGCNPCGCDSTGTLPLTHCDSMTGQCYCKQQGSGVTGRACNECFEKFYNFNKKIGNCSRCDCYEPGSKSEFCDLVSGQCECKDFVTSRRCDTCVTGSSHLNADNPYGCSKIPAQQPPPLHTQLSSEALHLYWYEPDYTNGVINSYRLFRNATLVFVGNGSDMEFNDTGLLAFTKYTYVIEATNDFGSIYSPAVTFQTLPGIPVGIVLINTMAVTVNTATLSWNQPVNINGPLSSYSVQSETIGSNNRTVHWTGMTKSAEIIDLVPFTNYTVFVVTCTPGGCHESWPTSFFTKSAPPSGMAAPLIDIVSYSELNITWVPPEKANGIIIYYELWMRGAKKLDGSYDPIPTRIFHPGGQYNPRPTLSPQENTLPPPDTVYIMSGLEPFTWYEFQVLAENNKGKTASPWIGSKTGEAVPLEMSSPKVLSHSSTAVTINWTAPSENEARGMIQSYGVFFFEPTNETAFPFAPPFMWKLLVTTNANDSVLFPSC
ncbi:USH2A [Mytilus edulis]|uniref:USH2A n=1 Tax=Mytilus edulis TaxID=6550 RepID=A0A8S3TP22_MYTED|nr:USH2A [Mytilus edulis]